MYTCFICDLPTKTCLCDKIDHFFNVKAKGVPVAYGDRCLACFFAPCRCFGKPIEEPEGEDDVL